MVVAETAKVMGVATAEDDELNRDICWRPRIAFVELLPCQYWETLVERGMDTG